MNAIRPIDETYAEVEKLIYFAVHRFWRRHGGDFDEMVGIANQVFMDTYTAYDDAKGSLSNYLITNITWRLQNDRAASRKQKTVSLNAPLNGGEADLGDCLEDRKSHPVFNFSEFCEHMTEDAKTVIALVLDSPADLIAVAEGRGGHYYNWRAAVRVWLHENKGWAWKRVGEAFDEVSEVLAAG